MNPGRSDILGEHAANPPTNGSGFGGGTIPTSVCSACGWIAPVTEVNKNCARARRETVGCLGHMIIKEWKCSSLEDRITAQFEDEVRRRARMAYLNVLTSSNPLDQLEGQRMAAAYTDEFAAGAYNWDDDELSPVNHVKAAKSKVWGTIYLLWLCMRRVDETVTEAQAKAILFANTAEAMRTYLWILGVAKNEQPPFPTAANGASRSVSGERVNTTPQDSRPHQLQADLPRVVNLPPTEQTFG